MSRRLPWRTAARRTGLDSKGRPPLPPALFLCLAGAGAHRIGSPLCAPHTSLGSACRSRRDVGDSHRRRSAEGHRRRCFELAWHPLMGMPTPEPMTHDRRDNTTLDPEERADLHLTAIRLWANVLVSFWPCRRGSATDHLWVAVAGAADHLSSTVPV